jgi:RNA polymerase sigma-70 factor (ECF subfamily)
MEERDERALVDRCRRGDRQAFAALVDQYKGIVFALIGRLVSDRELVEDLAQEVFIRVYQGLERFRGEARLSTWIYRIAYNTCVAELERPHHRARFVPIDGRSDDAEPAPELADPTHDPDEVFTRIDFERSVGELLDRLPPAHRMALALYYLEGRRYEEISAVMDLPLGTVKTYLHRAKQRLRNLIVERGLWNEMSSEHGASPVSP